MERHQRIQLKKTSRSTNQPVQVSSFQTRGFGVQQKAAATPASKAELWENYQRSSQMTQQGAGRTRSTIQTKLSIGQPGDKYEQEADSVADRVMAMSEPAQVQREELGEEEEELQMKPLAGTISPLVQREELPEEEEELQMKPEDHAIQREALPEEEEELQMKSLDNSIQREALPEEEEELQMKESPTPNSQLSTNSLEDRLSSSKGGGSPLSDDVRSFMEPRFGADFSGVRVHTGSDAVQMNQDVSAQAFAHGRDVYFGAGKAPGKNALTAHELTHVVQQTGDNISLKNVEMSDRINLNRQQGNTPLISNLLLAKSSQPTNINLDRSTNQTSSSHDLSRIAPFYQAKLSVSQPAAAYEQEAEKVAQPEMEIGHPSILNQVMRDPSVSDSPTDEQKNLIKEQEFAGLGATALAALGNGAQATGSGGHGVVSKVAGFPDWFENIQDTLIRSTAWGDPQESAQNLLHDYSVWNLSGKQGNNKHLHPSLERFFRYLGRSAANKKTNAAYKKNGVSTPNVGELGAGQGYAWCGSATSKIVIEALKEKGLRIKNKLGVMDQVWINNSRLQVNQPQVHTTELYPGDQVSFVDQNTPASGHVVTIVEANGDTFTTVSGNAGGVTGGSVRMGQVTRATPPPNYNYSEAIKSDNPSYKGPKKPNNPGIVWIISLVRYSSIDPSQIDPNDAATLRRYGLERINPVKK